MIHINCDCIEWRRWPNCQCGYLSNAGLPIEANVPKGQKTSPGNARNVNVGNAGITPGSMNRRSNANA
jgi:hypothetical protein